MHPLLNIAISAARRAGLVIVRHYDEGARLKISTKGPNDFVTNVDQAVEQEIIEVIHKSYPHHGIMAEESAFLAPEREDIIWIIDPIDGTHNFIKSIPHFAVSIAVQIKGIIEFGVVFDPIKQELFSASKGGGAQLNGHRIRCSPCEKLEGAVIGLGFPVCERQKLAQFSAPYNKIFESCSDFRRSGSAALDLAYVAAGRFDAYWDCGLKPWDSAAGALMVREAGGYVSDFQGNSSYFETGEIIAGARKVYPELLHLIQATL